MSSETSANEIDNYIQLFPDDVQEKLHALRKTLRQCAPEAAEKISYKMPTYYLHGNLVHFAAYKNHIGFYPTPDAIESFAAELTPYATSKGAIQFPNNKPLPLDLICRMVKYRVEKNLNMAEAKSRKK